MVTLRKAAGYKQVDLAASLGTTQARISLYERGNTVPSTDSIIALAQTLNTTTDYLLGLSDVPHPGAEPDANADLTPDEIELLNLYRARSAANRKRLLDILAIMGDMQDDD